MADLAELVIFYREQAARERGELGAVTLPMVRAKHQAAIDRWERLAARADLAIANRARGADRDLVEEDAAQGDRARP